MAGVSQNSSGGGRVMGAKRKPTLLSWSLHFGIQGSGGLSTEVACGWRRPVTAPTRVWGCSQACAALRPHLSSDPVRPPPGVGIVQVQGGRSPRGQGDQPVLVLTDAHTEALMKRKVDGLCQWSQWGKMHITLFPPPCLLCSSRFYPHFQGPTQMCLLTHPPPALHRPSS